MKTFSFDAYNGLAKKLNKCKTGSVSYRQNQLSFSKLGANS